MTSDQEKLLRLRKIITENLRVQRGKGETVPYIDTTGALVDIGSKQNHAIFARRGCGKTLLLANSVRGLDDSVKAVYLNCEDFKRHSFPNVLIEILDELFKDLEGRFKGWFGKKKRLRELIKNIRKEFDKLRKEADLQEEAIRKMAAADKSQSVSFGLGTSVTPNASAALSENVSGQTERQYKVLKDKIGMLDVWLPRLKEQIREFFAVSDSVKVVFLHLDDFYHLKRGDQALVVDFIHRLCKDLPLYFKIATLRHASRLYVDRDGQPIGAQERHDYQPINIDYTFTDFKRTRDQNRQILNEFAKLAGMTSAEVDTLFKGQGFERLVMAGGGVPRDTLSLFLEVLSTVQSHGSNQIGKDDVRILSGSNFQRRIEELKQDSEGPDQDILMRGIYILREFCLNKKTNVFVISEQTLQQQDDLRSLIYRLLDYRIIHNAGNALTHKSLAGTFQAYAIDIGCYAHLRKLDGRFNEIDVSMPDMKEKLRSAPAFNMAEFETALKSVPRDIEAQLLIEGTVG